MPAPLMSIQAAREALRWPTGRDLLFSAKTVLAVTLALFIGFSQNLENPYWSALTIYVVVSQPQAGAIRSKALFRLGGTLIGAAATILLAALFGSHVGVLLIVLLISMVATLYARLLDRTPANYLWFATSLTIAVIGVVHLQAPDTIFTYGVTRAGEIALGVLCVGLVDSILFPVRMTPAFVEAMESWRGAATGLASDALAPHTLYAPADRLRRRDRLREIVAALAPLDAQGVQLPYDVVARPPSRRAIRYLRLMTGRLTLELASANIWIEAVRGARAGTPPIDTELAHVRAWIGERPAIRSEAALDHAGCGEALARDLAARGEALAQDTARETMLCATTLARLADLVGHWAGVTRALHAVATGARLPPSLRGAAERARPVRSIDYVAAALDILPLVLALSFVATVWYLTAWTAGINALLFVFVASGFIIGQPGAVRSAQGELLWISTAFALTFLYQFAVLPRVTAFPVLMLVLAMALFPLGVLLAMTPAALLVTANSFAFLGLQNAYAADFGSTLQSLGGAITGCLIAAGALHLCGYDSARFRARRLARALSADVVAACTARTPPALDRTISLATDRLSLFLNATAALPEDDPLRRLDLLARFRIGANILLLRGAERRLGPAARDAVERLRAGIAAAYRHGGPPERAPLIALASDTYDRVAAEPAGPERAQALMALTGLGVALRPDLALDTLLEERAHDA